MPFVQQNRQAAARAAKRAPRPATFARAPKPSGPISGPRSGWRRLSSRVCARINELLDRLPPGRWLHQRAQRGLEYSAVDIELRRGGSGLDGLRIAFLSDLHLGSFLDVADMCGIFARLAELQPDMICFGGDLINTRERELLMLREPLALVDPPLGIFAVPGNHDHFFGKDIGLWSAWLRDQGVEVLTNRGVRIERDGASLWICGVDDLTEADPDVERALDGVRDDEPVLLLSHHPDVFVESAELGVDLQLSGHTHGGQIVMFGWTPLKHSANGYWRGRFEDGESQLYVGRGVGVTLLPIRWGAPAELPIVRLRVRG